MRVHWKTIGATIVGAILIVAVGAGIRYVAAYNNFLDKITTPKASTKSYSVIVRADAAADDLAQLAGHELAFFAGDTTANRAEQYLREQIDFGAGHYEDVGLLVDTLASNISTGIVMESDRLQALTEEAAAPDTATASAVTDGTAVAELSAAQFLSTKARVLYAFEVELGTPSPTMDSRDVTSESFIVYISGTDSREGVRAVARSDVNIIAVVNPATAKILLVSIPRDTYVQLHGTTGLKDKLTHAGIYGVEMSRATIEDFLGITIDYTLKVSFETVVQVVDQLDGIEIESELAMTLGATSKDKQCHYVVGVQHVDGDCALRFARERKSYATGDRHRGENQQQVITSIITRLTSSRDYLLKVPAILDIAADSFETTLSRSQVSALVRFQLSTSPSWQVDSISIDGTSAMLPTYSMGSALPLYVMLPDASSVASATALINSAR